MHANNILLFQLLGLRNYSYSAFTVHLLVEKIPCLSSDNGTKTNRRNYLRATVKNKNKIKNPGLLHVKILCKI